MGGFEGISTVSGWADALAGMLLEAEAAVASRDSAAVDDLRRRLLAFAVRSGPDQSDELRELDRLASRARASLAMARIDWSIDEIAARTSEFAVLRKRIDGVG